MERLSDQNEIKFAKNHIYDVLLIGKQGIGKTTILKLLTFDNTNTNNEISTSIEKGTIEFDFQKYNFNYDNKSVSLNILDTIGFIGDKQTDDTKINELIESIRQNFTHLSSIILVFSQSRFDKLDEDITNLIYNNFYEKFKENILIVITHCPRKVKGRILEEFKQKE